MQPKSGRAVEQTETWMAERGFPDLSLPFPMEQPEAFEPPAFPFPFPVEGASPERAAPFTVEDVLLPPPIFEEQVQPPILLPPPVVSAGTRAAAPTFIDGVDLPPPVPATEAPPAPAAAPATVDVDRNRLRTTEQAPPAARSATPSGYLSPLDLATLQTEAEVEDIPIPEGTTPEDAAWIRSINAERRELAAAALRGQQESAVRTAATEAMVNLSQDAMAEKQALLERRAAERERMAVRRDQVLGQIDEDYQRVRALAKEEPGLSGKEMAQAVAVAAMGALNSVLNGVPPGQGATALKGYIDARAAQRADRIQRAQAAVDAGKGMYDQLRAEGREVEYYEGLAKADLYEDVAARADLLSSQATSNEQRIGFAYAANDARARAQQSMDQARTAAEKAAMDAEKDRLDAAAKAEQIRASKARTAQEWSSLQLRQRELENQRAERQEARAERGEQRQYEHRQDTVLAPTGQRLTYRSHQEAGDIATKAGNAQDLVNIIDELQRLRNKHGREWSKTADGQKMVSTYRRLFLKVKDVEELGAITGPDEAIIEGVIGKDPTDSVLTDFMDGIQQTRALTVDGINTMLRAKLIDENERANYQSWNPAPPAPVLPSAENASTTIQTGSKDEVEGAVDELVASIRKEHGEDWHAPALEALVREELKLEEQLKTLKPNTPERRDLRRRLEAVRDAQTRPESAMSRKQRIEIAKTARQAHSVEMQKVTKLSEALGRYGYKPGDNPYMTALERYQAARAEGDGELAADILEDVGKSGFDLITFRQRAGVR